MQIGDKIVVNGYTGYYAGPINKQSSNQLLIEIIQENGSTNGWSRDSDVHSDYLSRASNRYYSFTKGEETLIEIKSNKITNMNILQKFALALKAEPQKSYQKAGITDSSDMLTEDGTKIFLTYLLNKDTDFKTAVVDGLLADEDK